MILKQLEIEYFRLFPYLKIQFSDGINVISGMNGQGKTSILEAIYYLALTKSFRTSNDNTVISHNKNHFNIQSTCSVQKSPDKKIRIFYSVNNGKHLFVNKKEIAKFSEYIGTIPCVILTLDDLKLTMGGPQDRRRFFDILISQLSPVYLEDLKTYRRIIQQRNTLLGNENKEAVKKQISIWNEQLVMHGTRIILYRLGFIDFLNDKLTEYYNKISVSNDEIKVVYRSNLSEDVTLLGEVQIRQLFYDKLPRLFEYEYERKITILGPHRDDFMFLKEKKSFKDYCSQGENKSLVIALKFLEWEYLSRERHLKPILLLDDIFGELDNSRMHGLLHFLEHIGQAHITTTMQEKFKGHKSYNNIILKDRQIYDG